MGQKVNPNGLRLGVNRTWNSRWFSDKEYANKLHDDLAIRTYVKKQLAQAGVGQIVIERVAKMIRINIQASRPGVIIGKRGEDIDKLKKQLAQKFGAEVQLNIIEIRKPELDANLVAQSIAQQIERRVGYKRAMKRAIQSAMRLGAQGIRIMCSGRLGGAEIARSEEYREGRVPLHTLRANVEYAVGSAFTTYGVCGIKVWIFKGEIMEHDPLAQEKRVQTLQSSR